MRELAALERLATAGLPAGAISEVDGEQRYGLLVTTNPARPSGQRFDQEHARVGGLGGEVSQRSVERELERRGIVMDVERALKCGERPLVRL